MLGDIGLRGMVVSAVQPLHTLKDLHPEYLLDPRCCLGCYGVTKPRNTLVFAGHGARTAAFETTTHWF